MRKTVIFSVWYFSFHYLILSSFPNQTIKTSNGKNDHDIYVYIILAMPDLQVESCPKQVNIFDIEQQIRQVDFRENANPQNIVCHSIYENWMRLKKIHEDTQIYILSFFVGSFLTVALKLYFMKVCEKALRTFYGVRNELQELRLKSAYQNA